MAHTTYTRNLVELCRAYNKILNLPKKYKVAPRSLIGYLVGYDSTSIFRVWIPQKRKVIRTKDVIFDENKFYDPQDPYTEELLQQSVPGKRVTLDILDLSSRDEADPFGVDESSSEDEGEDVFSGHNDTTAVAATRNPSLPTTIFLFSFQPPNLRLFQNAPHQLLQGKCLAMLVILGTLSVALDEGGPHLAAMKHISQTWRHLVIQRSFFSRLVATRNIPPGSIAAWTKELKNHRTRRGFSKPLIVRSRN
jgi:hypothetical protein